MKLTAKEVTEKFMVEALKQLEVYGDKRWATMEEADKDIAKAFDDYTNACYPYLYKAKWVDDIFENAANCFLKFFEEKRKLLQERIYRQARG